MFRTFALSIIRSFSLYTQQWYKSHRFSDSLRAGSGQSSVLILLASCQQTCMTYTIAVCTVKNSWWWKKELSEAVTSWSCSQALRKPVWHIPLFCVQWNTHDGGQRNCPKHVEFYSKNKFRENSASSWCYKNLLRSPKHQSVNQFRRKVGVLCSARKWVYVFISMER